MNLTKEQRDEILQKHQELEALKAPLKAEFKGIDSVIDQTIAAIRPFYIFPKSLKRPLIVNLWGLTGMGKTTLVNRIVDLLKLNHQYCRFDVGEYATQSSDWKLRSDLSEKAEKCLSKHLIVAFDEFQFGRTINEGGAEVDRSSLRPLWDIIDSGVITSWAGHSFNIVELLMKLKKCASSGVVVENGIVVEGEDVYNAIFASTYRRICDYSEVSDAISSKNSSQYDYVYKSEYSGLTKPYFIKFDHWETLYQSSPEKFDNIENFDHWQSRFRTGQNADELIRYIEREFILSTPLMKKEDYSQSLVFCLGNIDEAYAMTHSTNPDADADLFYEHSLKITTPKMKDALSSRFRMEQIGRLGNTHIIYPSLNRQAYCDIIQYHLDSRVKYFNEDFGLKLSFDKSVNDIIYKEAVFPTQGARPILSTFSTLIDSYITLIISDTVINMPDATKVEWKFIDGDKPQFTMIVSGKGKKKMTLEYPVKLNLEHLRKSDFSEGQAQVAVHEAGHAVVAIMKTRLVPQEVKSRTAGTAEGVTFVKQPTIETKHSLYNSILMGLGGLEAEKLIYGEDVMSSGGSSDLKMVTQIAASMIKIYGMGNEMHQIAIPTPNHSACVYDSDSNKSAEQAAIEIVKRALEEVKQCLIENQVFLVELSQYLSIHPTILEDELREMASKYTSVFKDKDEYYGFRTTLAEKAENYLDASLVLVQPKKAQKDISLTISAAAKD